MGYLGNAPADQAIQIGSDTILSSHIDDGVIVNDDINASASISVSKTALAGGTGLTLSTNTLNVDAAQTQIISVGTIGTGVWPGTKVASAYLDDDTAHLSTNQTFSGVKTFGADYTSFNGTGYIRGDNANKLTLQMGSSGFELKNNAYNATRLTISDSGTATFAGTITGSYSNSSGTDYLDGDAGLYLANSGSDGTMIKFGDTNAGLVYGGSGTGTFKLMQRENTALSFDASRNATFAGNIVGKTNSSITYSAGDATTTATGGALNVPGSDIVTGRLFLQGSSNSGTDLIGFNNETNQLALYNYTDGHYIMKFAHDSNVTFTNNITQSADANLRHTITAGGSGEASLVLTANNSTGDSFVRWETNANTFCLGLDNSDGNKFILSAGSDPHSNSVINIQPDGSSIAVDKPISFGGVVQLLDVAQSIDFIQSGAINFDSNGDQTGRVLTIGSNRAAGSSGGTTNVVFNEDGSTNFHDDVSFNRRIVQNGLNVYVKDVDVASSSGSTFTILRSWHDTANWGQGMYLVEIFQYYYSASTHGYASYHCTYGYGGGSTVVEQIANTGDINAPTWTGETTISGNLKMRNLELSVGAYKYVKIRVTTPDTYTDNADNNNNNTVHIYP